MLLSHGQPLRLFLQAVPCDPPAFLQPLHAAFLRAGAQLRLLDSLPQHPGRELVSQLGSIAEQEAHCLAAVAAAGAGDAAAAAAAAGEAGAVAAGQAPCGAASGLPCSSALPGPPGPGQQAVAAAGEQQEGSWLSLSGASSADEQAGVSLLLTTSQLQQVSC